MSRLPPHHVPRPRLTERCAGEEVVVVVVEAAAGYGKTVLGAELVDAWGAVPIELTLEPGDVSAHLLAARLHAAVARAGFADAAGLMAQAGADPVAAVDVMVDCLQGESCAIVIDDAHNAARDAGVLIDRIASRVRAPQRLAVLTRRLPEGAERLRRAEAVQLTAADLALQPEETLELCRSGFGLEVSREDGRLLDTLSGGWTAAAVLAASRAKHTDRSVRAVAAQAGDAQDPVGALLDELLVALGPDRARLALLAPLPLLDRELLATVTGEDGFLDRAAALGLPLTATTNGWYELPGPVRDHLAELGAVDPAALGRAAEHYQRRGQLTPALQMLLGASEVEAAARLLAEAEPREIERIEVLELLSVIDRIPDAVLDRFPAVMLHAVRSCHAANLLQRRSGFLERLDAVVGEADRPELRRAVDAEIATDLALDGTTPEQAEYLARRVLAAATETEQFTRARALSVIGKSLWWRSDEGGRRSVARMREAAAYFDQAWEILVGLGQRAAAAALTPYRAVWIEFELGRPLAALDLLNEGLALSLDNPRRYTSVLLFRAKVLGELGRYEEADADFDEILRIARTLPDPANKIAYVHWERSIQRSMRGDAEATLAHIQQAEANRADWWDHGRFDFFADAADALGRVGHTALAWEYLERAQADPGDAERLIAMAECALLARHGDPAQAEERLLAVYDHGIVPREFWRVTLLRGYAALRRGDLEAGALAARAFEEAARLGAPQLPLIRERELTEALLALAVETGSPAARALEGASLPVALALLGRFELTEGGRALPLGSGQAAQLVKLVAVSGGRIHAEQAIEALWPDSDPAAGRNRLRTVLGRLRESAQDVVQREGELLCLASHVRVDLAQFQQESRQALALSSGDPAAALAVARSAIARYRGDLLPHDLYEDWADTPREQARKTMLELLDMCAAAAVERADLDEARRIVERTIELAPYDDDRYLKVASILHEQGRRGAALSVLRRARSTLAELGVPLPAEIQDFEETLVA
ncbi:MAG TPA: BTAD domain-containing putative transcriptional regulator [Solirubrobacteraceae bacterium]|nr:BTAD domain-containing putative transcriptional regulator [Solirubrobacteraceae bacterium]